jgi:DGQHR domain-containing protein
MERPQVMAAHSIKRISVIVPESPFVGPDLRRNRPCLAALDVDQLMRWWPGTPHTPHRDPEKVQSIQRSLDWKRVAQIAAYLLQEEILDARERLDKYFKEIYEPTALEPGRDWPPRVSKVVGFEPSEYPAFSNILLHVNGAKLRPLKDGAGQLSFDENSSKLNFSVIDGQHRINGAFFALCILREKRPETWQIPCEIFLDLDKAGEPARRQAQIFIDVNFYQKKVDRSLVADLFPTARGREPLSDTERAQDIGRRLMLDTGPLVGMIQIPGIRYGTKDVIALATLNSAIRETLPYLTHARVRSLQGQTDFLAACINAWLRSTGRKEPESANQLDPTNVVYQGRVIGSVLSLTPACIWKLRQSEIALLADESEAVLTTWLRQILNHAGLMKQRKFLSKTDFTKKGFLGSGGIGRFRDTLWAAALGRKVSKLHPNTRADLARQNRERIESDLRL